MIAKIIELSIKNKFLVILATLFVIAAGIYAILRTPLDAIPDLSDVQVIIFTEYRRAGPPGGGRPGHLSADHRHALRALCQGRCAATPFSAFPSSTSSSRTAPISTGPAAGCWST